MDDPVEQALKDLSLACRNARLGYEWIDPRVEVIRGAFAELQARAEAAERDAADAKRRYTWAANELLACDYGDNPRGEVGWIVYGWRWKGHGPVRIYGPTIDAAIELDTFDAALKEPPHAG